MQPRGQLNLGGIDMAEVMTCKNCSAPLEYREGDAVAYCTFCGEVNRFREEKAQGEHFMLELNFDQNGARNLLVGDLLKIPGVRESVKTSLEIVKAELVYLPFYVAQVHGHLNWAGYGRQANFHNPYKGAYKNITFHTEPESGEFDDMITAIVYSGDERNPVVLNYRFAAKGRKFFAIAEIEQNGGIHIPEAFDFAEAEKRAMQRLEAKHTALLHEELDRIDSVTPNYQIGQNSLIHVPIWFLTWKISGSDDQKHSIIDAASGVTLETDVPGRGAYLLMTTGISIVFVILGLLPYLLLQSMVTVAITWALPMLFGFVLGGQTIYKNWPRKFKESET